MRRWIACALAAGCAVPAVIVLHARGDAALAGSSPIAQAVSVAAGVLLALAAATWPAPARPVALAAAAGAWLAAEWANPAAPGALVFTAGLVAAGLSLPLVLVAASFPRPLVLVAAAGALLLGPLAAVAADPRALGCPDCPADLLAAGGSAGWVWRAGAWASLLAGAAAPLLARRPLAISLPAASFGAATAVELALRLRAGASGASTAHLLAAGALLALAAGTRERPLRLWRARRAITAATTAVAAGEGESPAPALARVAGDVTLLYAVPGLGWVDAGGRAAGRPPDGSTLVEEHGAAIAAIVHAGRKPDPALLDAAVAAGRLRLDAERLQAAALARLEALRGARRRVVRASDDERRRLERDLHDGTQQRLVALRFALGLARHRAGGDVAERLAAADSILERALAELRELAHGLYPASLDGAGLATALPAVAERSALAVEVGAVPARRFAPELEASAYRIVADALALAERAGASTARLEAVDGHTRLILRIEHDGAGTADLEPLDDRVQALAGTLRADGAALVAEVPCA